MLMKKTRGNDRKFVQKWRDEYGEDPPHMRDTPVEMVPEGCNWKTGDPPLGLKKSLELAPISGSCVIL